MPYKVIAHSKERHAIMIEVRDDGSIIRVLAVLPFTPLPSIGECVSEGWQLAESDLVAEIHDPHSTYNEDGRYLVRSFRRNGPSLTAYYSTVIAAHEAAWTYTK